jgi:hypothetical protein
MNISKGSIRIFPKLKRGTVENGVQKLFSDYCFYLIREKPADENKRQKKTKGMFSDHFVVRIPYIETLFITQLLFQQNALVY